MHDALRPCFFERGADLLEELGEPARRQLPAAQMMREIVAVEPLHHEVRDRVALVARGEHAHDVR